MEKVKRYLPYLLAVVIIAIVSLAFFWPDAIEGNSLRQHDMQQGLANGQELAEYKASTGEQAWWTNSLFGGMPAFQISPSYGSTALFSWLNKVYGLFLPAPSNLLAMMMLGMFILLLAMRCRPALALTGAVAWGLSSYFVILIGAGHLWKFITLAYVPPTIAGLVLIYRGKYLWGAALAALFMALQISSNHVQMSYYFAWVMAGMVIAYGVKALRAKELKGWGISTGVLAGAMLLAVAANLPNLYHTYEYSKYTMRGQHSELTQPASAGDNSTSGLDRDYITMYSYQQGETLSLLIPNIRGGATAAPVKGQMTGLSLADTPEGEALMRQGGELSLLPIFSPYFGGAEGTNGPVYVGAIIVALFLLGAIIVKGPLKWALVILTLLSIFLAWGRNMQWFTDLFIDYMPAYSKFRTVESILVIAQFTMPVLGILGLRELFKSATPWATYKRPLLISFGIAAGLCLIGVLWPGAYGSAVMTEGDLLTFQRYQQYGVLPAEYNLGDFPRVLQAVESMRLELVKADALRSLLFIGVAAIVLIMWSRGKLQSKWALAIVGVAVLADLYTADKRYLSHESFVAKSTQSVPFAPSAADQAILLDRTPHYRVLDVPGFQQAAPSYFHKAIGGYHAAKLTRYQDLIDRHLGYVARPEISDLLALRSDSVAAAYDANDVQWLRSHLNVLDMLNCRYIITDPNSAPIYNEYALGNAWFVDRVLTVSTADEEMDALESINPALEAVTTRQFADLLAGGQAPLPGDSISLTGYAPDRLTYSYKAGGPRTAVFSEIYFPWGWEAEVDGKRVEIARVDYLLRALPLPAGTHEVTMAFKPKSVATTNTVATIAIILTYMLLAGAIIGSFRRK